MIQLPGTFQGCSSIQAAEVKDSMECRAVINHAEAISLLLFDEAMLLVIDVLWCHHCQVLNVASIVEGEQLRI